MPAEQLPEQSDTFNLTETMREIKPQALFTPDKSPKINI